MCGRTAAGLIYSENMDAALRCKTSAFKPELQVGDGVGGPTWAKLEQGQGSYTESLQAPSISDNTNGQQF